MIIVKIVYREQDIVQVEVKGHAGFAKFGKDIVCSAISAITQTALLGLIDVSDADVKYTRSDDGYLKFDVPTAKTAEEGLKQQAVLGAMVLGVRDVEKGYKPYVKTEVSNLCL